MHLFSKYDTPFVVRLEITLSQTRLVSGRCLDGQRIGPCLAILMLHNNSEHYVKCPFHLHQTCIENRCKECNEIYPAFDLDTYTYI